MQTGGRIFRKRAPSGGHGPCPLIPTLPGSLPGRPSGCSPHPGEPLAAGPPLSTRRRPRRSRKGAGSRWRSTIRPCLQREPRERLQGHGHAQVHQPASGCMTSGAARPTTMGASGVRPARRHPAAGGRAGRGSADPAVLFNAVELHRDRTDGEAGQEDRGGPAARVQPQAARAGAGGVIRENLNVDGYAATYAIHEDREGNNPHAHILVANRQTDQATGGWLQASSSAWSTCWTSGESGCRVDPRPAGRRTDKRGRRQ